MGDAGESDVGKVVYIDNPRSVFHGLRGVVVEIEGCTSGMTRVRIDRKDRDPREVWFEGWELRGDRFTTGAAARSILKLEIVE